MILPNSTKLKKLKIQHNRCYYCGCLLNNVKIEIDHIVPKSKGGSGCVSNLCLACKHCNRLKADKDNNEFYKVLYYKYPDKLIRGMFYYEFLGFNRKNGS